MSEQIKFNQNIQAQLILGEKDQVVTYTKQLLKKLFCKNNVCHKCVTCKQVEENRHAKILWINPEKQYTLDDIEVIFDKISY